MDSKRRDKGLFKSESSRQSMDYPGMWRVPKNPENCCIYRVPDSIRRVNPEAYTPQLLIIGPLHHSLKSQALESLGDITETKSMGYLNMEAHKKFYLAEFAQRFGGEETIDGLRRIIEESEEIIRESYSESTTWIESSDFVEMILHDSVFIIEFIIFRRCLHERTEKTGDPLMDEPCLVYIVHNDLIMLENQLPYFILEKLFDPILPALDFRKLIIAYFGFDDKDKNNSTFHHFTDLVRCVRVETLPDFALRIFKQPVEHMYNVDKLNSGGVKFEAVEEEFSLDVWFDNGCLKIPCLKVFDELELILRNIIAFEQCHYPYSAHVCNYVHFLDFLIDTDKDVDLLVEKGIIKNNIGEHRSVAEMVNKLCIGVILNAGSYYYDISVDVNNYYTNPFKGSCAILRNVYFRNLWTGTATVVATLLLVMTLLQTVASIIQVMQNAP